MVAAALKNLLTAEQVGDMYSIDDATSADSINELQGTIMTMDLNDQQHDGGITFEAVQCTSSELNQDHKRGTDGMSSIEAVDSTHTSSNNRFVLQCRLTIASYKLFPVLRSISFDPIELSPLFDKLATTNSWKFSIHFVAIYIDALTIRDYTVLVRESELLSIIIFYLLYRRQI